MHIQTEFVPLEIKISNREKSLTGFTLVELLVVIAVIALLMSILMPALARVRKQAKVVLCQSNLKQWGACFAMYTDAHDGYFMKGWVELLVPGVTNFHTDMWMEALRPYYGNEGDLRCCPRATKPGTELGLGPYGGHGPFVAWGVFEGENCGEAWSWQAVTTCDYGSYGGNGYVYNPPPEVTETQGSNTEWNWRRDDVKAAAQIPLFLDAQWWDGWPRQDNTPPDWDGQAWDYCGNDMMIRFCINRHDSFVNSAFLDYSVRKVGLKELWKLKWHRTYDLNADPPTEWDDPDHWMHPMKDYE